ncbi:MAG: ABC transporter permease [Candidatus Binatia bacterium]
MSIATALQEAMRTLRTQWLRALLTLFGIVWGTASVVFLVAWGLGVRALMETTYERVGHNFVSIWVGIIGEDFTPAADRRQLWLTRDDVDAVRARLRRGDTVVGEARRWSVATFRQRALSVNLRGIEAPELALRGATIGAGRPITTADVTHRRRVVVLGDLARRRLLGPGAGVGAWIRIEGRPYRVVGLLAAVGTQLWQDGPTAIDEEAWVPLSSLFALGPRFGTDTEIVDAIALRVHDRTQYDALRREIRGILAPRLGVSVHDEEAIHVVSPLDSLRNLPLDQMDGLLLTLSVATLAIGGVGVLTMMLDAVHDRRQEIGVRLAVGARRRDVVLQFLVETFTITALGGALGLLLGLAGCGILAALDVPDLVPVPIVRPSVVLTAVSVLMIVGLAAGVGPAWRAARVDPSVTLRSE